MNCCFSLSFLLVNKEYFGFGLLVGQKKQFKGVTWGFRKLLFHMFLGLIGGEKIQQINCEWKTTTLVSALLVSFKQQSQTQKHFIYCCIWWRKPWNPHIWWDGNYQNYQNSCWWIFSQSANQPSTIFNLSFELRMQNGVGLRFPCRELTCCCTQHETNVGMTMRLSQLLFFQVQSCCPPPPPPPPPPVLLSSDAPLVVITVLCQSGISPSDRSSHSNAPASRSLRRERGTTEEWLVGERYCLSVSVGERPGRSERKRLWEWVSWSLDRGTTLGIYAEAYGTRLSWIHRGSTGIHAQFSFHTVVQSCLYALW